MNDKQASHANTSDGHDHHCPAVGHVLDPRDQEIQHLKLTIARLTADLEAERAKLHRATEGARFLDERVWELQQLLHKMNRPLSQRILDALRALRQVCVEFVR